MSAMDLDDSTIYLARMKASAQQRKLSLEAKEGTPNPNQERTLLLREVDTMNEEEIIQLFHPQFKDTIESIRLFPPIPGTRGFAFIEFADATTAIRAMTLRHRTTVMYRGAPKKLFLSRVTGFKQEDEMKWKKYQERSQRSNGRGDFDSTPRRVTLVKNGQLYRPDGTVKPIGGAPDEPVRTVPLEELQASKAGGEKKDADSTQRRSTSPHRGRSLERPDGQAKDARKEGAEVQQSEKETGYTGESSRSLRDNDRRSAEPSSPGRRRESPDRRRSPARYSFADRSRAASSSSRREPDRSSCFDFRDRRSPDRRARESYDDSRSRPSAAPRDREPYQSDRYGDRQSARDRLPDDRRDSDRSGIRGRDARDDDLDDRKRRRYDDDNSRTRLGRDDDNYGRTSSRSARDDDRSGYQGRSRGESYASSDRRRY